MKSYLELLQHVLDNGTERSDRTNTGTRSVFGHQFRHDMATGFPLLTTKKVHFQSVLGELLWFLSGSTNVKELQSMGVTIWNEWADPDTGDLGPVYGAQWRNWHGIERRPGGALVAVDQILGLIEGIKATPDSRRLVVSAWNPVDVPSMALPPCHTLWQVQVDNGLLHLSLYCRSIDAFLGLPFNIASYALLLTLLARVTGLQPGQLVISFGDLHIYNNHLRQVHEQLNRAPRKLPQVLIDGPTDNIDGFGMNHFQLVNYDPHPAIKAPVAV